MNPKIHQFINQTFLNLETYRKNGEAMRTPVWFIEADGVLFIRTISKSGKVKRLRNNTMVRVVPCEADGRITGKWVEGKAQMVIEPIETSRIEELFDMKYGEARKRFDLQSKVEGLTYAAIAVYL